MSERRDVPRETNPLVVALAEVAVAVVERRREAQARRSTIRIVGATKPGKEAA